MLLGQLGWAVPRVPIPWLGRYWGAFAVAGAAPAQHGAVCATVSPRHPASSTESPCAQRCGWAGEARVLQTFAFPPASFSLWGSGQKRGIFFPAMSGGDRQRGTRGDRSCWQKVLPHKPPVSCGLWRFLGRVYGPELPQVLFGLSCPCHLGSPQPALAEEGARDPQVTVPPVLLGPLGRMWSSRFGSLFVPFSLFSSL